VLTTISAVLLNRFFNGAAPRAADDRPRESAARQ
jgi:hypothetical protein